MADVLEPDFQEGFDFFWFLCSFHYELVVCARLVAMVAFCACQVYVIGNMFPLLKPLFNNIEKKSAEKFGKKSDLRR